MSESPETTTPETSTAPAGPVLPDPICVLGYTSGQVEQIVTEQLGPDKMHLFQDWMRGQTGGFCDGSVPSDPDAPETSPPCGPHGVVTYEPDMRRFVESGAGRG
ncbi:hypothetical protein [Nocardioides sp. LML1-1-1.1]|uniref:hypothetical protein n=1 Tax=Nocardioides sp. LML1-1-1.1 TaxID=3135248 RepID=UPI00343B4026